MWGPLVLAGDLGEEQEGRKTAAPVFVAAERPLAEWLKPVAGRPGTFHTDGVGKDKDVDLVPFYRLHRRTYAIYWDLFTPGQWQEKAAAYAAAQERQRKTEAATVAFVQPGEMQPETDYNYQGEGARIGRVMDRQRAARRGGQWFSFDVPLDPAHPATLIVTYSNEERQQRSFEILVDGTRVGEQTIERITPEQEPRLFDVDYPLAAELIKDKQKVTVRFQASGTGQVGTVCGIRMIRADAER
jgi:uncharacterized protein